MTSINSDKTHIDDSDLFSSNFTIFDNDVFFSIKGKYSIKILYLTLLSFKNNSSSRDFPSYETIRKIANLSNASIWRGLTYLQENGYIEIHKRKNRDNKIINVYKFLNPLNKKKALSDDNKEKNVMKIGNEIISDDKEVTSFSDDLSEENLEEMMSQIEKKVKEKGIEVSFYDYFKWYKNELNTRKIKPENHFNSFKKWGLNGFIQEKEKDLNPLL